MNRYIKIKGVNTVDGILPLTDSNLTFIKQKTHRVTTEVDCFYKGEQVYENTFYYDCWTKQYFELRKINIYEKKEYEPGDKILISRNGYIKEATIDRSHYGKDREYIMNDHSLYDSLKNYDSDIKPKDVEDGFYRVQVWKCNYHLEEYGFVEKQYFYKPNQT